MESDDPQERLAKLIAKLYRNMQASMPLGRKLIKLTVDDAMTDATSPTPADAAT